MSVLTAFKTDEIGAAVRELGQVQHMRIDACSETHVLLCRVDGLFGLMRTRASRIWLDSLHLALLVALK